MRTTKSGLLYVRPKEVGERYIAGDLRLEDIKLISQHPHSVTKVYLALVSEVGLQCGDPVVKLTLGKVNPFNLKSRKAKIFALKVLEKLGIVELEQDGQEAYVVTMLPYKEVEKW